MKLTSMERFNWLIFLMNMLCFLGARRRMFKSTRFRIVVWDVLPCKIIVDRRFRCACCLHHHPWWFQKTILNFILAAVRTWNLTSLLRLTSFEIFSWLPHSHHFNTLISEPTLERFFMLFKTESVYMRRPNRVEFCPLSSHVQTEG
jgi:hypothetical protein